MIRQHHYADSRVDGRWWCLSRSSILRARTLFDSVLHCSSGTTLLHCSSPHSSSDASQLGGFFFAEADRVVCVYFTNDRATFHVRSSHMHPKSAKRTDGRVLLPNLLENSITQKMDVVNCKRPTEKYVVTRATSTWLK